MRKLVPPKVQPILQPQPRNKTLLDIHPMPEAPITILPRGTKCSGRKPPLRQPDYKMPVCRESILPPPTPKQPDRPIESVTPAHKLPKIEEEPIDIDAI